MKTGIVALLFVLSFNVIAAENLHVEYGKISLSSASIFLWPETSNEAEAVKLYKEVAVDSAKLDQLELRRQKARSELDTLNSSGFDYSPCFKNFELSCSATAPASPSTQSCDDFQINNDTIQNWVYTNINQVPGDDLKSLFTACRDFTDTKLGVRDSLAKLMAPSLELVAKILYRIDPGLKRTGVQTNYKKFRNPGGSSLMITQGTVNDSAEIRLDGFGDDRNYQSSVDNESTFDGSSLVNGRIHDVVYSHKDQTLSFKVPEILDGKATGGVYSFILERSDFGGNPRFSGDLLYTKGTVTRNGSARLDGQFL